MFKITIELTPYELSRLYAIVKVSRFDNEDTEDSEFLSLAETQTLSDKVNKSYNKTFNRDYEINNT